MIKKAWLCLFALAPLLFSKGDSLGPARVFAHQANDVYLPIVFWNVECRDQIPAQPVSDAAMEAETLRQINIERAANGGLAPLTMNATLVQVARFHSIDMAVNDFFDHFGSAGESPWDRYGWMCEKFSNKGEIIAAGYTSARAVVEAWMNSPGHRAIILTAEFTVAGVGYTLRPTSHYGSYWTVNFGIPASPESAALLPGEPAGFTTETIVTPDGVIRATLGP